MGAWNDGECWLITVCPHSRARLYLGCGQAWRLASPKLHALATRISGLGYFAALQTSCPTDFARIFRVVILEIPMGRAGAVDSVMGRAEPSRGFDCGCALCTKKPPSMSRWYHFCHREQRIPIFVLIFSYDDSGRTVFDAKKK